jgi:hypothetical protein
MTWQRVAWVITVISLAVIILAGAQSCAPPPVPPRNTYEIARAACEEVLADQCLELRLDVVRVCRLNAIIEPIINGVSDAKVNAADFRKVLNKEENQ